MYVCRLFPAAKCRVVAPLAVGRESQRIVIGVDRPREVFPVTGFAIGRGSGEFLSVGGAVAGFAISDGMHTGQWEAALGVLQQHVGLRLPVTSYMALLTVVPQLSLMVVSVAICTGRADMAKHQIFVTRAAGDTPMSAVQPKTGFIVREFHLLR
jgi:hypothetical protein